MSLLKENESKNKDFKNNILSKQTFVKAVQLVLVQVLVFPFIVIASTKIPLVGAVLKYVIGSSTALESYSEMLDLEHQLSNQAQKTRMLEKVNEELTGTLSRIQLDHPELFDELKPEEKNKQKYLVAATIVVIFLGILFYMGNDSGHGTLIESGIAIANESDRLNGVRTDALATRLDAITDHLIAQDTVISNTVREAAITRTGVNGLMNLFTVDTSSVPNVPTSTAPRLTYTNLPDSQASLPTPLLSSSTSAGSGPDLR